jgi:hypothetical protein
VQYLKQDTSLDAQTQLKGGCCKAEREGEREDRSNDGWVLAGLLRKQINVVLLRHADSWEILASFVGV